MQMQRPVYLYIYMYIYIYVLYMYADRTCEDMRAQRSVLQHNRASTTGAARNFSAAHEAVVVRPHVPALQMQVGLVQGFQSRVEEIRFTDLGVSASGFYIILVCVYIYVYITTCIILQSILFCSILCCSALLYYTVPFILQSNFMSYFQCIVLYYMIRIVCSVLHFHVQDLGTAPTQ